MNCVSHITHGLWTLPGNNRHRFNEIEYWTELAELLEYGAFDAVFLADVVGAYDTFRGGLDTALTEAVQIPNNDPLLVIPAMARSRRASASAPPSRRPMNRRSRSPAGQARSTT